MKFSAGTTIPIGMALGVAGWACWSHLGDGPAPAVAREKPPVLADALLAPDLGAPSGRDPFRLPGDPAPSPPKPTAVAGVEGPGSAEGLLTKVRRLMALAASKSSPDKTAGEAAARAEAMRGALGRLALGATSVLGDRRIAIIAGRSYDEGEALEGTDPALGAVVLAEVRRDGVTLQSGGTTVALGFPAPSARSSGRGPAPDAATPPSRAKRGRAGR